MTGGKGEEPISEQVVGEKGEANVNIPPPKFICFYTSSAYMYASFESGSRPNSSAKIEKDYNFEMTVDIYTLLARTINHLRDFRMIL